MTITSDKRQVNALSVRRVRDGGFIVVEDSFDMGQMREVVFADGDISVVLQYVRSKLDWYS